MRVKNKCSIFLRFGIKKAKIPVNPEEIEVQYSADHKTYDVLGAGEIVVPKKPSLKVVSWDGFFPKNVNASYVNSGARKPEFYVRCFEEALKEKQICRLIISRTGGFETNMKCIVSDFKIKDKGGEPGDIYYSVKLQEYKFYVPSTVTVITPPAALVPVLGNASGSGSSGSGFGKSAGAGAGTVSASAPAAVETPRPVEVPVLRVGATVVVNGIYCNDSYGSKPHGTANNITTAVRRIVSGSPYPVLVGNYGWVQESQLQVKDDRLPF